MRQAAMLLFLIITPLGYAQKTSEEALKSLQGAWKVSKLVISGEPQPKGKMPKQLVFKGDKLTGFGPPMRVKVGPRKTPKEIDLVFSRNGKEFPVRAIYRIKGNELQICLPFATTDKPFKNIRPGSFDSKGKEVGVLTAVREK